MTAEITDLEGRLTRYLESRVARLKADHEAKALAKEESEKAFENGLARDFIKRYDGTLSYFPELGKWFIWTPTGWERDDMRIPTKPPGYNGIMPPGIPG